VSSDPFDEKNNLPPWLRDVRLPPRPRDIDEHAAPAQPGAPDPTVQAPAWLGENRTEAGQVVPAPRADTQDWPRSEPQPSTPTGTSDQSGLPDWLRDSQANQSASPGNAEQLPTWLHDIGDTSPAPEQPPADQPTASPAGEVNLPDWLRESQRDAPAAPPEPLPDWLRDMAGETPGQEEPALAGEPTEWPQEQTADSSTTESEYIPDWLRNQDRESSPASQPNVSTDLSADLDLPSLPAADSGSAPPNWLGAPDESPAQPVGGAAAINDATTPDWLHDSSANAEEIDSTVEPFTFEESPGTASSADMSSLPAWLGSGDDTADTSAALPAWLKDTSDQAASPNEPAATADAPGWLADTNNQAPAENESPAGRPEVPLWLQDIDQRAADIAPASPSASESAEPPAEGVPPWLQDTSASQPPAAESVPSWLQETPASPPSAETLPSWLQDTAAQPAPTEDVPAWLQEKPAAQPPAQDLPSWLQETPASPPSAETLPSWLQDTAAQPAPTEDVPAWPQHTSTDQPSAEPPAEDLPTWLHEAPATETTGPAAPPNGAPAVPTSEPSEADKLPQWLRPTGAPQAPTTAAGQDIPPWLRDEAGQPLPTAGTPGDTNLPAWLRGATIDRAPAAEISHPPAASAPQSGSTNFDWFADEAAPALPQPSANNTTNELIGGIELPAWLRPPEPEQPKELNATDARSLDWLTRLGGHEEEESISAVAAPAYKLKPPSTPARTPAQVEAIALLQRLAAQPYPEAEPIVAAEAPSIWRRFGLERLLYLALLLALVAALALPISGSLGLNTPPAAPGADDLFAQIGRLTENDTVLVGYEWDARRSGELRPLEQAVLGQLIDHKVKLVLVSTDAQGTLLLFDLRDRLGAAGYKPSGEDYILLGYKPGAELALRSIAQDFRGALRSDFQGNDATSSGLATNPGGQPRLNSLADFAMVLVLADEPADVQGWMEQVHPSANKANGSLVPFGFLLPAETAPIVQPYLSQPSIYHLSGKQGALTYQQLRGDKTTAQIAVEAGQQRVSLVIYIALFLIGAVAIGISSVVARGRNRS